MRCFITGITGFVGQHLAKHLAEQGAEVFGICVKGQVDSLPVRAVHCDLLDGEKLNGLLSEFRPAQIYHLAALVNPLESLQAPQSYYLVNVQGTVNLLESLRQNRLETRLLVVSSAEVYGPNGSNVLLTEEAPAAPLNPYASSKMLGEKSVRCTGSVMTSA